MYYESPFLTRLFYFLAALASLGTVAMMYKFWPVANLVMVVFALGLAEVAVLAGFGEGLHYLNDIVHLQRAQIAQLETLTNRSQNVQSTNTNKYPSTSTSKYPSTNTKKYPYLFKHKDKVIYHNNKEFVVGSKIFNSSDKAKHYIDSNT